MKKISHTILPLLFLTICLFSSTVSYAKEDTVEAERAHTPTKSIPIELNSFPDDTDSTLSSMDDEEEFHFIQAFDQVPADSNDITSKSTIVAKMNIFFYVVPAIIISFVLIKHLKK